MQRCRHMRTGARERGTNGPANLPVRFDSRTDEMRPRRKNEIPCHPLPNEMEIVVVAPHVLTRARDRIHLPLRVVGCCPRMSHSTDVRLRIEDADRALRAEPLADH